MNGIIYKATNLMNGKIYIGQTITSLEKRIKKHYYDAKSDNLYFHRALNKYDKKDWEWKIIDNGSSLLELNNKEKYWISFYESNTAAKGYNLTIGGEGIVGLNKESYDKARQTRINKGLSKKAKQREQSALNFKKGNKAVLCLNTNIIYTNAEAAAKALGFENDLKNSANAIRKCARGDTKTARGFKWEYLSEEEGREYAPGAVKLEETGEIFRTVEQASVLTHQSRLNIYQCCNGNIQDNVGYHWSWVNKTV